MSGLTFALCEPSSATVRSKEHIRLVGPEGLKLGGGIPNAALCGFDLHYGWDLIAPVVVSRLAPDAEINPTCRDCMAAWRHARED